MGKIIGAGLISHAPVVMMPRAVRLRENDGRDFTLATGLARLRREVFDAHDYDTVLVLDSHWRTTTEAVVTAHARRAGRFTSDEMPNAIRQLPYDLAGDPELARAIAGLATRHACWIAAVDDPCLPIHYATLNPWTYLGRPDKRWISMSVCQTATTDDFLRMGEIVAQAISRLDRNVLLVASGGLSHAFWPLAELRRRMAGAASNIVTPAARAADERRIAWLEQGRHDRVIDAMPEFLRFDPEANFGHYLMMAGAIGARACTARARRFSEYENGIGTGHVHLWFSPVDGGWTRAETRAEREAARA
ncbi:catechol 1,2-dioxygenase [Burkholderia thailandensis]|uniref:Catalytic LigB subunit of aromatic ring-opening dioxygenase family protein n=1 Tax=Burkholderia thailandensis TaxID=57975 RepID=A0AAW9CNJ3_BURTH|nr:catecholic dioxygenase [Burkholderia thailandensis]AHI67475.1 catalytic LigB subunit of aromatic ring-opening dioxygenase family protein [Burkholderia thailandensis H0587]AOJ52891.1 catechol 1,2-dioxygenase [Burkholderia thailandensis]AVR28994.1 catechol 1,2-dioxygenase [Burkholderia thailandensis]MCS3392463.1 catechol 1,2-dioxygenase [Burkholderia thailandensis]MCS6425256.1 catechol 1,2-dioxygenase [Burkholderia thailandensis]